MKSTVITHYPGPSDTLSWTSEGTEKWTRSITGIEGGLAAIQEAAKSPVLQLRDLEGNIVATAEDSETATKLISSYNSTEFGVPQPGTAPPKYAWLGAEGVSSEPSQAAGAGTQSGTSYVPEIGRALQTTSVESPGSFPNGTGGVGIVRAPYLGAAVNECTETAVREQAASEEAKKTEAYERAYEPEGFCEKYASSSACHVDGPGEGNCEVNCLTVIGGAEEEYFYAEARGMAEEGEQQALSEHGTNATSASVKLRLSVGCLEAGFWTYCSGKYHGSWFNSKAATNPQTSGTSFSTGDRIAAAGIGLGLFIKGGLTGAACVTAAAVTPGDDAWPFLPLEIHCAASAFSNMALGAAGILVSIFGEV